MIWRSQDRFRPILKEKSLYFNPQKKGLVIFFHVKNTWHGGEYTHKKMNVKTGLKQADAPNWKRLFRR